MYPCSLASDLQGVGARRQRASIVKAGEVGKWQISVGVAGSSHVKMKGCAREAETVGASGRGAKGS